MSTEEERYYQTNGVQIHAVMWEKADSDATPLVILHGMWESWHTFARLAPRFAQKRMVYALDLRGHGASDKPAKGYRLQDYAADVLGILEQCHTTRSTCLVIRLGVSPLSNSLGSGQRVLPGWYSKIHRSSWSSNRRRSLARWSNYSRSSSSLSRS